MKKDAIGDRPQLYHNGEKGHKAGVCLCVLFLCFHGCCIIYTITNKD